MQPLFKLVVEKSIKDLLGASAGGFGKRAGGGGFILMVATFQEGTYS